MFYNDTIYIMDKKMSETLDLMIKHNSMVDNNNFLLRHLGMTWDEFQNLPNRPSKICEKHFEENCVGCFITSKN